MDAYNRPLDSIAVPMPMPEPGLGRAWKIFGVYLLLQALVQTILGAVIGARIAVESGGVADAEAFAMALQSLAGPGACVAGAAAGLAVLRMLPRSLDERAGAGVYVSWWAPAGLREMVLPAVAGMLLAAAYVYVGDSFYPVDATVQQGPLATMAQSPGSRQWLWATFAVLCAPAIEEILFRGVLLTALQRAWGTICAAAVVSLIFVALHAGEAAGYPPAMFAIGGVGVLTLVLRLRTGKIAPAISAHAGYNLVIVANALGLI
jgi:membrane protease YdiL (CAAX protease family)